MNGKASASEVGLLSFCHLISAQQPQYSAGIGTQKRPSSDARVRPEQTFEYSLQSAALALAANCPWQTPTQKITIAQATVVVEGIIIFVDAFMETACRR
jgi:hypothetical protein